MRKVALWANLLIWLCLVSTITKAQQWNFNPRAKYNYEKILDLDFSEVYTTLQDPKTAQEKYVVSLAQTLELLITEDLEKYNIYHDYYEDHLGERTESSLEEDLFLHAEIRLQWAFIYLKFGHEFDAVRSLKDAYTDVQECKKKFPNYTPINKASAILEILIGTIPKKYNWVLSLMGMEGNIEKGLKELEVLRNDKDSNLFLECDLIYALLQSHVFHNPEAGLAEINRLLQQQPNNRLINFLGAGIAIKSNHNEVALNMLLKVQEHAVTFPIPYVDYLKGEVYLQRGEYRDAITAYRWFVRNFKGRHLIKDAHYKMALCYLLNGYTNDALHLFDEAKNKGIDVCEADKEASRMLLEDKLPNIPLSKARYLTDGGFYDQAQQLLDSVRSTEIPDHRDHIEYYYRKARIAHKKKDEAEAIKWYLETIKNTKHEDTWYFAPNSCLQLGYIYARQGDKKQAEIYFKGALDYDRHGYKNSIDSKAKSALAQLNEDKWDVSLDKPTSKRPSK